MPGSQSMEASSSPWDSMNDSTNAQSIINQEAEMKEILVKSAAGTVFVKLNRYSNSDELMPEMARAARDIAFGLGASAVVSDGPKRYWVTWHSVRKMRNWEDGEY